MTRTDRDMLVAALELLVKGNVLTYEEVGKATEGGPQAIWQLINARHVDLIFGKMLDEVDDSTVTCPHCYEKQDFNIYSLFRKEKRGEDPEFDLGCHECGKTFRVEYSFRPVIKTHKK